ncbi:MAG: polysaccharide deacetylase family protein, partial [Flavobacterium sp.]
MKLYWIKTHRLIKKFFPGFVWDVPNTTKTVYLTFDDGPTPEVTEWVLDELRKHDIKATFFCIGNNIENHPGI